MREKQRNISKPIDRNVNRIISYVTTKFKMQLLKNLGHFEKDCREKAGGLPVHQNFFQ